MLLLPERYLLVMFVPYSDAPVCARFLSYVFSVSNWSWPFTTPV